MDYSVNSKPDGQEIVLRGRFTFADYQNFRTLLGALESSGAKRHVFDMGAVEFIDSAALGMMLIAHDEAKRHGWTVRIARPQGQVRRTLEIAALHTLFPIDG